MHHGKFNLLQPICFNSASKTSLLTMVGVTVDSTEEVDSMSRLTSLV